MIAANWTTIDLVEVHDARGPEVVVRDERKLGFFDEDTLGVVRVGSRIVVVEEVGGGTAGKCSGGRHVVAVAVGLREVNHGVGDRTGTGDVACGEVVSVEVERLAGVHRDLSEHLVVDEREVVECLVNQRVGERATGGALCFEPLARGAAVAHRVVEADGAAGVLCGNEVELQVPLRVIDLERVEEVGSVVGVGVGGA